MRYIGGKNGEGVAQRIINLIPPHRVYIEPCLGSGAVLRAKKPAEISVGLDLSPAAISAAELARVPGARLILGCGIEFLERFEWHGDEFVYADPPYLLSTRGGRRYYEHEMSDDDHRRLLAALKRCKGMAMISGYYSDLYAAELRDWTMETFTIYTRQHRPRTECLWFNYPRPTVLHDARFVGANRRERWNLEKQRRTARAKFLRMDPLRRASLFSALVDVMREAGQL